MWMRFSTFPLFSSVKRYQPTMRAPGKRRKAWSVFCVGCNIGSRQADRVWLCDQKAGKAFAKTFLAVHWDYMKDEKGHVEENVGSFRGAQSRKAGKAWRSSNKETAEEESESCKFWSQFKRARNCDHVQQGAHCRLPHVTFGSRPLKVQASASL